MVNEVKEIQFGENGDDRGKLVAIEGLKDIPIKIERVFYIYNTDNSSIRGCHANRNSEFVLISVSGKAKVKVRDGRTEKVFYLDAPNKGLYIPKMIWKEMYDFSEEAILLCLASEPYDADEYIYDYNEYTLEMSK